MSVWETGKRLGEERATESPERVEKVIRRPVHCLQLLICLGWCFLSAVQLPSTFQLRGLLDRRPIAPPSLARASQLLLKTLLNSSASRASSSGHEYFLPKVILSSLLDFFFLFLFSSWELLGGGFDFLCVEAITELNHRQFSCL